MQIIRNSLLDYFKKNIPFTYESETDDAIILGVNSQQDAYKFYYDELSRVPSNFTTEATPTSVIFVNHELHYIIKLFLHNVNAQQELDKQSAYVKLSKETKDTLQLFIDLNLISKTKVIEVINENEAKKKSTK